MTNDEFINQYWADFRSRFPGKASWFEKNGEMAVSTWYDVLQTADLADAIEANRRVQNGDWELDGNWDEIPQAIRNLSEQSKINRICGSYRRSEEPPEVGESRNPLDCAACHDTGMVIVDDGKQGTGYACRCRRGDRYGVWRQKNGEAIEYPRYGVKS